MDKHNILLKITPDLSNEQADLFGTLIFQQLMLNRLIEKRETGKKKYQGWHTTDDGSTWEQRIRTAVEEKRWVDVANLAMMLELKRDVNG